MTAIVAILAGALVVQSLGVGAVLAWVFLKGERERTRANNWAIARNVGEFGRIERADRGNTTIAGTPERWHDDRYDDAMPVGVGSE